MGSNEWEWEGIIALNIITQLLKLNARDRICWACIGADNHFREVQTEDFEALHKALKEGDFKGSIVISLWKDGTGLVGWKLDAAEKEA